MFSVSIYRSVRAAATRLSVLVLLALSVGLFSLLFAGNAYAQSSNGPLIFDVRRSLPLEPNEPVAKDFYINAGPESGLKKGVYINVVRAIPIHDPIQNKQQATLNVPVGSLQVIHVENGITVARLQNELTDGDRPTLEFEGVMVGDRVDLASITTKAPKKSGDKSGDKSAEGKWFSGTAPAKPAEAVVGTPATPALEATSSASASVSVAVPPAAAEPALAQPSSASQPTPAARPEAPIQPQAPLPGGRSADTSGDSTDGLNYEPIFGTPERNAFPTPAAPGTVRIASGING